MAEGTLVTNTTLANVTANCLRLMKCVAAPDSSAGHFHLGGRHFCPFLVVRNPNFRFWV